MSKKSNRFGLYLTIIFHLVIIIILLTYSIHSVVRKDSSFLIDFSEQEKEEAIQKQETEKLKEEKMKESVADELNKLLGKSSASVPRNAIVNADKHVKDDRFKNSDEVYDEAKELQRKLDEARREAEKYQDGENIYHNIKKKTNKKTQAYSGPSVLSYSLDGRNSLYLPIPAYKCYGSGDVSVAIVVNRNGYVVSAKIIESVSSKDDCLIRMAIKAAKSSRFTASSTAPSHQAGSIVYRFVAQ